ncbi:hypothetical protein OOJ96_05270 [Pseudomonas sp. 15FMM2]|uniref:Uncharacterized protein n=1 Tax=Pseudomonas imrae TaxID=2992837 RepID=A0ACC7PAQ2_9PSED
MSDEALAGNCRLSLSQPRVDYGLIRSAEVVDRQLILGKRTLQLSIVCAEAAPMSLRFTGVSAGTKGFRFGRQGYFTLSLQHPQVDGLAVELRVSGEPASGQLLPGQTLVARAGGAPMQGHRFTALVNIETFVPVLGLAVRDETTLEGQGSFEWVPGA